MVTAVASYAGTGFLGDVRNGRPRLRTLQYPCHLLEVYADELARLSAIVTHSGDEAVRAILLGCTPSRGFEYKEHRELSDVRI